jgi:hypothetical protein
MADGCAPLSSSAASRRKICPLQGQFANVRAPHANEARQIAKGETRTMSRVFALLLTSAVALAASGMSARAQETKNGQTLYEQRDSRLELSNKKWAQSDTCGKESFHKFPDFTEQAATQRDAYMRECLRNHNLPPRADLVKPR